MPKPLKKVANAPQSEGSINIQPKVTIRMDYADDIEVDLKNPNFGAVIRALIEFSDANDSSCVIAFNEKVRNRVYDNHFSFDLVQNPHCCGIDEIGGFNFTNTPKAEQLEFLKKFFDFYSAHSPRTVIISLSSEKAGKSILLKPLLSEEYWTCVKTFVNNSTKNTIYLFINNNQ